jgi:integrase
MDELGRLIPEIAKEEFAVAAAVLLIILTPIRIGDLLKLDRDSLRLGSTPHVLPSTLHPALNRAVPIGPTARALIEEQNARVPPGDRFLFPARHRSDGPMAVRSARRGLKAAAATARLEGVTFLDLRRTFAIQLYRQGVSDCVVRKLLGRAYEGPLKWRWLWSVHSPAGWAALEQWEAALLGSSSIATAMAALLGDGRSALVPPRLGLS